MEHVPMFLKTRVTRVARHYFALKLFHPRLCSFCSPIWGLPIHPSICSAKNFSSNPTFLKISKGAVGFLCTCSQLCRYCSRKLAASFPGFWWPHRENSTLMIISEACFKVKDITGNGETGWNSGGVLGILITSWLSLLLVYDSSFLGLISWLSFISAFLDSKNLLFHSESALGRWQ